MNRNRTTSIIQLAAADTAKTLITSPSGGADLKDKSHIRIHRIVYLSETASANGIAVACGATELCLIVNLAANSIFDTGFHDEGVSLPVETAVIATETAGPKGKFWITWSIE